MISTEPSVDPLSTSTIKQVSLSQSLRSCPNKKIVSLQLFQFKTTIATYWPTFTNTLSYVVN